MSKSTDKQNKPERVPDGQRTLARDVVSLSRQGKKPNQIRKHFPEATPAFIHLACADPTIADDIGQAEKRKSEDACRAENAKQFVPQPWPASREPLQYPRISLCEGLTWYRFGRPWSYVDAVAGEEDRDGNFSAFPEVERLFIDEFRAGRLDPRSEGIPIPAKLLETSRHAIILHLIVDAIEIRERRTMQSGKPTGDTPIEYFPKVDISSDELVALAERMSPTGKRPGDAVDRDDNGQGINSPEEPTRREKQKQETAARYQRWYDLSQEVKKEYRQKGESCRPSTLTRAVYKRLPPEDQPGTPDTILRRLNDDYSGWSA